MKQLLSITIIILFGLSGCSHIGGHGYQQHSLHETLNAVKEELRAFNYALNVDSNNDGDPDMAFRCGGKTYPVAKHIAISDIEVAVTVKKTTDTRGLNVDSVVSLGGAGPNANSLTLHLEPNSIPKNDYFARASNNGIANNLIAIVNQLAQTNSNEPCLGRGEKSTIALGFNVESSKSTTGKTDLVVFSSNGEHNATRRNRNEIKVTFNFGDISTQSIYN